MPQGLNKGSNFARIFLQLNNCETAATKKDIRKKKKMIPPPVGIKILMLISHKSNFTQRTYVFGNFAMKIHPAVNAK